MRLFGGDRFRAAPREHYKAAAWLTPRVDLAEQLVDKIQDVSSDASIWLHWSNDCDNIQFSIEENGIAPVRKRVDWCDTLTADRMLDIIEDLLGEDGW